MTINTLAWILSSDRMFDAIMENIAVLKHAGYERSGAILKDFCTTKNVLPFNTDLTNWSHVAHILIKHSQRMHK